MKEPGSLESSRGISSITQRGLGYREISSNVRSYGRRKREREREGRNNDVLIRNVLAPQMIVSACADDGRQRFGNR